LGQLTSGDVPVDTEYIQSTDSVTRRDPRTIPIAKRKNALRDLKNSSKGLMLDPVDI